MPRYMQGQVARRRGAIVTVSVTHSESRYPLGEFVIRATYRCEDGTVEHDRATRVYLGLSTGPAICQLWNALFDATLVAQDCAPRAISIRLQIEAAPPLWRARARAVAEVVAHELKVVLRGTVGAGGESLAL